MAIRSLTLTTAAGLALLCAPLANAGQANVSLATGSAAATSTTTPTVTEAASAAAASLTIAAQTPAPAPAPEPEPPSVTGGVNVDLFSHYVWRGFVLTDGFAFQPSVYVSTKGLTLTSWSSWSSTDYGCFDPDDCPAIREHDFTVDYTRAVGNGSLSVGYINYLFPPARTDAAKAVDAVGLTNELYAGYTFTAPGNPFVKAYFDVDGNDTTDSSRGTYLQFGVSQPIPLAEGKATLTPMFSVGYNFKQWIADNEWNDANLGVKVAIPVSSHFTITPSAYISIGLNDTVRSLGYGDDPLDPARAKFYGGVGFSYVF
jgi:hypothetical protein